MRTAILIILTFFFNLPLFFSQPGISDDFKTKTEIFYKKYLVDYSVSKETIEASGLQWTLDNNSKHLWTKKVTLKSKKPFINKYNQTSYQRLYFAFYQYANEQNGKSALDSLIKNFPVECCLHLTIGENVRSLKTIPALYLFNKKEIITCHLECEQLQNNWTGIQHDIINIFGNGQSIIMTTGCGGPLEWKKKN